MAFAAAVLAATALLADTWYEAYDKAEQALTEERWADAAALLTAALEEQPASGARSRTYGMRFIAYFPFLKLGIAYYHLGQADAALRAFETEERQGAVAKSAAASAQLTTYRERIERERRAAQTDRRDRADSIITQGLAEARRLETAGQLEDALAALANVLAVAPDHAEAGAARDRILSAAREAQRQRDVQQRFDELLRQGRIDVDAGAFQQAAARFSEALTLRPSDDQARSLLETARGRLRADLPPASQPAAPQQAAPVSPLPGIMTRAQRLEQSGDLDATLAALQEALAIAPRDPAARAMEARIIARQQETASSLRQQGETAQLLADADAGLAASDYERALRAANRVLVLDPVNAAALRTIARAYAGLSDILLAADQGPPTIVVDNLRPQDGARTVRSPALVLTGRVYDSTKVELSFLDQDQPIGQATTEARNLQGVWITEFRWQNDARPGDSTVAIVAVDTNGNRTELPVAFTYAVPFLRSRWFPVSIAGGLGLVVLSVVSVRVGRRRKLLRGRFNPYTAGAPILEQTRFFGRQQLLDYVLRRIGNNSVMLYGERRIGKTSFQHRLKRCLVRLDDPDHAFFPVYIDLQGTPEDRFFATLAAEIFHELTPKLDGVAPELPPRGEDYGYRELVKDLHRVLKALKAKTKKKVKLVLLIDEVDELNDYDPRVNQRLRSLFMRAFAENLVSVVSGVSIKKHWEREGSPWYNFFQEVEVKPLDLEEARALIEAPVKGVFGFEDGTTAEIIRRTHGKPYLIQRLCSAMVDRLHEEKRQRITAADVEAACQVEGL